MRTVSPEAPSIRRAAGQALVAGLTVAAFTAVVALIAGSFDDIDELNRGPSNRAPEIRREVERLRDLARSFQA